MSDEALTFSELRKIQKTESRQEELADLGDSFILRVSDYIHTLGEGREYRNAKRVFDKILSLREEKIVKNAKLSVKSEVDVDDLALLPEEQELYRELKALFHGHRESIDEKIGNGTSDIQPDEDLEPVEEEETEVEDEQEAAEDQDEDGGYETVKITSEVPEFMGTDLETYGPFDEGSEVKVPEENAQILVNRGNAEVVE